MAIAPTPEMLEAADDLRESSEHAAQLVGGSGPAGEPLDPELEEALLTALQGELATAEAVTGPVHKKWTSYLRLLYGRGMHDNPSDPLSKHKFYWPMVAKLVNQSVAILSNRLFPNHSTTTFFRLKAAMTGLAGAAGLLTSMMQHKFKVMRPDDAPNFFELALRLMRNWFALGNCFSIVTHRGMLVGTDRVDETRSGPVVNYVAPLNVSVLRTDVGSIDQTDAFIYQPLDDWDLDEFGPELAARVRTESAPGAARRVGDGQEHVDTGQENETFGGEKDLYRSHVKLGHFPVHELATHFQLGTEADRMLEARKWTQALAARFGFPMVDELDQDGNLLRPGAYDLSGQLRRWWLIRWAGEVLLQCEPYPLVLPQNGCPLKHHKMIPKNDHLFGDGLYDMAHVDERFQNMLLRNLMALVSLQCRPPFIVRRQLIDPKQWQEWDGDPSLEPDMPILAIPDPSAPNIPPYEVLNWNVQTIPLLESQIKARQESGREMTGVTSALEGDDQSGTATQAANNAAFSLALTEMYENGWSGHLEDVVKTAYMTQWQAMKVANLSSMAPHSDEELTLRMVTIRPEHLLSEDLIEVEIITASSPMSRQQQLGAIERFMQLAGPTGMAFMPEVMKDYVKLLGGDPERWLVPGMGAALGEMIRNAMMFGGPGAVMQVMGMMGAGAAGGGMPMGAPSVNSAGGAEGAGPAGAQPRLGGARPGGNGSSRTPAMMEGRQATPSMQGSTGAGAPRMNGG